MSAPASGIISGEQPKRIRLRSRSPTTRISRTRSACAPRQKASRSASRTRCSAPTSRRNATRFARSTTRSVRDKFSQYAPSKSTSRSSSHSEPTQSGNAHVWGNLGTTLESARAAERVIVLTEELVEPDVIRSEPNRTLIPGLLVDAVVVEPGAAHPSPVEGYRERDHAAFEAYHRATRTPEGFEAWRREWIENVGDRAAYMQESAARERANVDGRRSGTADCGSRRRLRRDASSFDRLRCRKIDART